MLEPALPLREAAILRSAQSQDQNSSTFPTTLHGHCRHCNHLHDAAEVTLSHDSQERVSVNCDRCQKKMFSLGRRSTHNSIISQETIPSMTFASPSRLRRACNNNSSARIGAPLDNSVAEPLDDVHAETTLAEQQAHPSDDSAKSVSQVTEVDFTTREATTNPPEPISSIAQGDRPRFNQPQWDPSGSVANSGLRIRFFQKVSKVTKRVAKLCGVRMQVTVAPLKCAPPTRQQRLLSNIPPVDNLTLARRLAVDSLGPEPAQDRRPSAAAISQADTLRGSRDGDVQAEASATLGAPFSASGSQLNSGLARSERIREQRRLKTVEAERLCRCDSFCSCNERHGVVQVVDMNASSSDMRVPSMISSRTDSGSTQSTSSVAQTANMAHMIRGLGLRFVSRRNSLGSVISSRGSRRSSRISRPSRLSSVTFSEASSGSRPGSSGPPLAVVLDPSPPEVPFLERPRDLSTVTQNSRNDRPMLTPLFTANPESMIAEDEEDEQLLVAPRARSSSSQDSVTPTQATVNVEAEFARRRSTPL